jgi:deoxyadenosine/deoxycytidine kinase
MLFVVDGNIGAGKTTLLEAVHRICPTYTVLYEPLLEWTEPVIEGEPSVLELFYSDPGAYAFELQMNILRARFQLLMDHKDAVNDPDQVVIVERSVHTDLHIFGQLMVADGHFTASQLDTLSKWVRALYATFPMLASPTGHVYLEKPTDVCVSQIKSRSRSQEKQIDVRYIEQLHARHNSWFASLPTHNRLKLSDSLEANQLVGFVETFRKNVKDN